jgi:intein-encoded DNA endonuclease-like protein
MTNIQKRNKQVAILRWKRIHRREKQYAEKHKRGNIHLICRLCGFVAGDGNIYIGSKKTNRHYLLRFFPDHSSLIKPFKNAIMNIYNKKPKVRKLKNYFCITIDSKTVVLDLLRYAKFGKLNWNVPKIATTKRNAREWLRAFFDCEAYVNRAYIRVHSINLKGLKQVKNLLAHFDIRSKIYEYRPKNKKWNANYQLMIFRKEDRIKFLREIGFNHAIKLKKLKYFLKNKKIKNEKI